jgi:alpha-L-rhamnosidase
MFKKAVPIWLDGLQAAMNVQAVFTASFLLDSKKPVKIRVTGASLYRIKINDVFAGYGPARAPHEYVRVDEIDISSMLCIGENQVEIEVAGYHCASFYLRKQLSFLCAEIVSEDRCLIYTGRDFKGKWRKSRLQKVMRYSFQRPFTEVYDNSRPDIDMDVIRLGVNLNYIERGTALPDYRLINEYSVKETGRLLEIPSTDFKKDRYIAEISSIFNGYREDELEAKPYYQLQTMKFIKEQPKHQEPPKRQELPLTISAGNYVLLDLGRNATGFIQSFIQANEDSHVMITFDEKLVEGIIDYRAIDMINLLDYHLKGQEEIYPLESFEAYGFRYLAVLVLQGEIVLKNFGVRGYQYPILRNVPPILDEELRKIYIAAVETFSQNTLDVYMDCPTRERAGWLCDSYFTAQAEYSITGKSDVERVFMNNFILSKHHPNVPKGMLPMCYPAEHLEGVFIPQWSMWYLLELEQFLKRCPDENPEKYQRLCYEMVEFFEGYRNKDGLLEKLPSWNFVEWSKANEWVFDVNYPTNMLYARVLEIIGTLYEDKKLLKECKIIRNEVIKQSFQGELFTDHSIRNEEGVLYNPGDISEVCQYYAVRFGLISIDDPKYQILRKYVLDVFGKPNNAEDLGKIEPANVLMGIYLRMEILLDMKEYRRLIEEVKQFFGGMAEHTGTLWEYKEMVGSLNHGFASYVAVVINKIMEQTEENLCDNR